MALPPVVRMLSAVLVACAFVGAAQAQTKDIERTGGPYVPTLVTASSCSPRHAR
jgi:hypothetical protein